MSIQDMTQATIQEQADAEIRKYGGGLETLMVASYVNQYGSSQERLFQWAHHSCREEAVKLISWALKNNRMVRFVPWNQFAAVE